MAQEIELAELDVRYEGYRMRNPALEKRMLASIMQGGIDQALEGTACGESKSVWSTGKAAATWPVFWLLFT
jgi:hypothetical protein